MKPCFVPLNDLNSRCVHWRYDDFKNTENSPDLLNLYRILELERYVVETNIIKNRENS